MTDPVFPCFGRVFWRWKVVRNQKAFLTTLASSCCNINSQSTTLQELIFQHRLFLIEEQYHTRLRFQQQNGNKRTGAYSGICSNKSYWNIIPQNSPEIDRCEKSKCPQLCCWRTWLVALSPVLVNSMVTIVKERRVFRCYALAIY